MRTLFLTLLCLATAAQSVPLAPRYPRAIPTKRYSQAISLHPGWNLVSWHLLFPEFGEETWMNEILPITQPPDPPTWFQEVEGRLWKHTLAGWNNCYPWLGQPSYDWVWDPNYAYYLNVSQSHNWLFTDHQPSYRPPLFITPDPAWDDMLDEYYPDQAANGWFFVGYSAPGYCKLASIYTEWPPLNGSEAYREYRGPFHWLYWDAQPGNHPHFIPPSQQYLIMVKDDQGKIYLPWDPYNPYYPDRPTNQEYQEYDEIGTLEPGRGYFLGFLRPTAPMGFDGWGAYPSWPQSVPQQPKPQSSQIASGGHFQHKFNTQWCYPVFIDTVDLTVTPMVSGDEIGILDGNLCVGAAVYTGEFPLKITCWKDDIATPNLLDGYQVGQEMTFVWYDVSTNQEITFELPPITGSLEEDPVVATHSGFGAGMYAMRSLVYGAQSVLQLPQEFKVNPNFPNPFNAETIIPLELPERSHVKIELFNVRGQSCGVIFNGVQNAGWPKLRLNASHLPSGVYFYRVMAEGLERNGRFTAAGKMLVLK